MSSHQTASTLALSGPSVVTKDVPPLIQTLTIHELYDRLEGWITERSVYAWQWSPNYKRYVKSEMARLRRELNRRDLPSRRWMYDDQCQAEDAKDLADTQADAIG